jgi:hypothetical protein
MILALFALIVVAMMLGGLARMIYVLYEDQIKRTGAAFDRSRERALDNERALRGLTEQVAIITRNVAYLVDIERQRMEAVRDTERATESLEEEVANTLAAANAQVAYRVRAFEERKRDFERSFLRPPAETEVEEPVEAEKA